MSSVHKKMEFLAVNHDCCFMYVSFQWLHYPHVYCSLSDLNHILQSNGKLPTCYRKLRGISIFRVCTWTYVSPPRAAIMRVVILYSKWNRSSKIHEQYRVESLQILLKNKLLPGHNYCHFFTMICSVVLLILTNVGGKKYN